MNKTRIRLQTVFAVLFFLLLGILHMRAEMLVGEDRSLQENWTICFSYGLQLVIVVLFERQDIAWALMGRAVLYGLLLFSGDLPDLISRLNGTQRGEVAPMLLLTVCDAILTAACLAAWGRVKLRKAKGQTEDKAKSRKKTDAYFAGALLLLLFSVLMIFSNVDHGGPTGLKLGTADKIAALYEENEEAFHRAADVLMGFDAESAVWIKTDEEDLWSDLFCVRKMGALWIESRAPLTEEEYRLLYVTFAPLYEIWPFEGIGRGSDRISFALEGPIYGDMAELWYFPEEGRAAEYGDVNFPGGSCAINDHWFAVIMQY